LEFCTAFDTIHWTKPAANLRKHGWNFNRCGLPKTSMPHVGSVTVYWLVTEAFSEEQWDRFIWSQIKLYHGYILYHWIIPQVVSQPDHRFPQMIIIFSPTLIHSFAKDFSFYAIAFSNEQPQMLVNIFLLHNIYLILLCNKLILK